MREDVESADGIYTRQIHVARLSDNLETVSLERGDNQQTPLLEQFLMKRVVFARGVLAGRLLGDPRSHLRLHHAVLTILLPLPDAAEFEFEVKWGRFCA